jgi:hypothetical protein
MLIIKSGRVEVSCRGADGRTNVIGQRGSEESCGETSCLLHKPRATTVTRTTRTNPDPELNPNPSPNPQPNPDPPEPQPEP